MDLATGVPGLPGYGASDKPASGGPETYSKRSTAGMAIAEEVGFDRFGLVGQDRGAFVAVRADLDHPDRTDYIGILDLPTLDTWAFLHGVDANVAWHHYLMAQPAGIPEKMIALVAPELYGQPGTSP